MPVQPLTSPSPWAGYVRLLAQVKAVFDKLAVEHPAEVRCHAGCRDCCQAPFRLQLVEAVSVNAAVAGLERNLRRRVRRRAEKGLDEAETLFARLPADPAAASEILSRARLSCPLLEGDGCAAYLARPVTCRLYGLPTQSRGQVHTCPKSGFSPGRTYPTVDLDKIFDQLAEMSLDLIQGAGMSPLLLAPRTVARAVLEDFPAGLGPF